MANKTPLTNKTNDFAQILPHLINERNPTMTTYSEQTVKCRLCNHSQTIYLLGSCSSFGAPDLDTRPAEMARSAIMSMLQVCPKCGFASFDISDDVGELGVKSFNIDDLREIADENTRLRIKEFGEAENIINDEFILLKESFKIMEVDEMLGNLRASMEEIRQRETQKASVKLANVDGSVKILDNLTNSIVNKIFFDISKNVKKAAKEENKDVIDAAEYIFDFN